MSKKIIDTTDYLRPNYICEEVVEKEGKQCIVVDVEGFRELESKDGEKYRKLYFTVEYPSGNRYEFGCSKITVKRFNEDISINAAEWVGAIIKFELAQSGKYYDATVITPPTPLVGVPK